MEFSKAMTMTKLNRLPKRWSLGIAGASNRIPCSAEAELDWRGWLNKNDVFVLRVAVAYSCAILDTPRRKPCTTADNITVFLAFLSRTIPIAPIAWHNTSVNARTGLLCRVETVFQRSKCYFREITFRAINLAPGITMPLFVVPCTPFAILCVGALGDVQTPASIFSCLRI